MLEQLFGSSTRVKMLRAFFQEPERAFFVREMARELDVQINGVRRELTALQEIDLVTEVDTPSSVDTSKAGSNLRKYYQVNLESMLYTEMNNLLTKVKLIEEQEFIHDVKNKGGDIQLFLLTGHFTGAETDTDMLLVGDDINERVIKKLIHAYEKEFGMSVRYTIFSEQEFQDRQNMMDKFVYSLFDADHIIVVDLLTNKK